MITMYANNFMNTGTTTGHAAAEISDMLHRYTAKIRTNQYNSGMRQLAERAMPLKDRAALGGEHSMASIDQAVGKPVELHAKDGRSIRAYVVSNNGILKVAERMPGYEDIGSIFYRPQKVYVPVKTTKVKTENFNSYHILQG